MRFWKLNVTSWLKKNVRRPAWLNWNDFKSRACHSRRNRQRRSSVMNYKTFDDLPVSVAAV